MRQVVKDFQKILNKIGDPIILNPTGESMINENNHYSIELKETYLLKENSNFEIPKPIPTCSTDSEEKYKINRIRISASTIDDYSKNYPLTETEILSILKDKEGLFAYY